MQDSTDDPFDAFDDLSPNPEPDPLLDMIPDVRDGLTREQRIILYCLHEAEKEWPGRHIPVPMLYGRVVEYLPMSKARFMQLLPHLVGQGVPQR